VLCLAALVHGRMGLERIPESNGGVQPAAP
jgi:hypothetical protein